MRHQSRERLEKLLKEQGPFNSVLEVGSLNVSGTVRDLFSDGQHGDYIGVDMRAGDGVDQVVNGHDLIEVFGKERFDLVVCFDTLEHDDAFWLTIENMRGVLKKGGWLIIGVPSRNCPLHDHPGDYWRFMPQSMSSIFLKDYLNLETIVDYDTDPGREDEIYGWGQKP